VSDRHRAAGDATATVKLFKMLLDKDVEKTIIKESIRLDPKHQMEPKLIDIISKLPSVTGVYYIHKADGEIIYIGKSKNIKSRINQHFTGQTPKSKKIQLEVATVTYDETGSELVALLKESEEIKRNKPKLNRALRRTIFTHGLFSFRNAEGYINLKIEKIKGNQKPITTFSNHESGKSFMNKIVDKNQLCQKLCGLYKTANSCFGYDIKSCAGACISEEPKETYNKRVLNVIESHTFKDQNMILIDYGRAVDERSAVLIENGVFRGYAYFNLNFQIHTTAVLKSILTPMEHNKDAQHIIQSFMRRHKRLKIIKLED
jgi:DNA polymerase-3 subunit epsilon